MNDSVAEKNIKEKIAIYSTYQIEKSAYRLSYLEKTIELLSNYGDVFLCRIPVHFQMLLIEDTHWKDFDSDIQKIANKYSVPYFSFRNSYKEYRTIDGNHLCQEDGAVFTRILCDSINSHNQ